VRVKADPEGFARRLTDAGCRAQRRDDRLVVQLPADATPQLLWRTAAENGQQIRYLRPQRSTLEEVFLKALEQP
jgi:ABC-2 type transport system ATP-binding protein